MHQSDGRRASVRCWFADWSKQLEIQDRGQRASNGPRLTKGATYFFRLLTASFSCLPALNLTALVAGILIRSAVWGL